MLLGRSKVSDVIARNCLFLLSFISFFRLDIERDAGLAQSPPSTIISSPTCKQLTSQRYAVIVDHLTVELNKLPYFLSSAALACRYLNTSMMFFGSFENLESSLLRVNQLKQLGLDASIHSFTDNHNQDSNQFRSSALLVELSINPNLTLQTVKAITRKPSFFGTFKNRSVILTAPLTNQKNASRLAHKLRKQGFTTQIINASWIDDRDSNSIPKKDDKTAKYFTYFSKNSSVRRKPYTLYRLLIPVDYIKQIRQMYTDFPDMFQRTFSGYSYIQVRSYLDPQNAYRERARLNINFPGTILEVERIYDGTGF
jgi:hypothetical protein